MMQHHRDLVGPPVELRIAPDDSSALDGGMIRPQLDLPLEQLMQQFRLFAQDASGIARSDNGTRHDWPQTYAQEGAT
jgi:hypothetical protein